MIFNSFEFILFFPIVFFLYWFLFQGHLKAQNFLLLVASYIFYAWWDYRFAGLIALSTLVDYVCGWQISKMTLVKFKKLYLTFSILFNIGLLAVFKYFNFFMDSASQLMGAIGFHFSPYSMSLILPLGISFYTFQSMSYTLDIYKDRVKPTPDAIAFFSYVSFFPQLVAGPIEKAKDLLPQFLRKRRFDYVQAVNGSRQILWGLFKKVVIADNAAVFVDRIFANPEGHSGSTLVLGLFLFTFQVYADFSGYSDMAIGFGRLLGFRLSKNFAYPFFAKDMAELWRRWHISLTTWFRDYVYYPMGGSRFGPRRKAINIIIVFLLIGLWHGAEWKFVVWGGVNAILVLMATNSRIKDVKNRGEFVYKLKSLGLIFTNFWIFTLTSVFFRASDIKVAWASLGNIFSYSFFTWPDISIRVYGVLLAIVIFTYIEWLGRNEEYAIEHRVLNQWALIRYSQYAVLIMVIILFAQRDQPYFYFQF